MNDRVEISLKDHVAHVKLNRPKKMNALDDQMFEAICGVGEKISKLDDVRAVVLSGEGPSFCAGLDMSNFDKLVDSDSSGLFGTLEERTKGIYNDYQYATWVWREIEVPVIAALHGVTIGGGIQIALGADMRYAAPDTKISIFEIKWGLIPDMGGSQLLRGLLRDDVIRELGYTGRMLAADEALALGLVTGVVENPLEHAMGLAKTIASKSPDAIKASKALYNDVHYKSVAEGMMQESTLQDKIVGKANHLEAVMSGLEKREPNFKA